MIGINECNTLSSWCFFDYFDTIVHRHCHPDAVKMIWAKEMKKRFPQFNAEFLWKVRKEAEQAIFVKAKYKHEVPYSELIFEMYSRLLYQLPEVSLKMFYEVCLDADIDAECSVQYLDQDTLKCIYKAKSENKNVAVITDFYLPQVAFERFFEYHGISALIDRCFVSSDLDARKSDGSLYDLVLNELSCKDLCSMMGDNKQSDYEIPSQKGIKAVHKQNVVNYAPCPTKKVIEKALFDIKKQIRQDIYGRYAFYFYYFTEKLVHEIQKKQIKDVFFLAREGQPLKKMFDWYLQQIGITEVRSHYLCASRASTLLASRKVLEQEKFFQYFTEYPDVTAKDFLHSLGFDAQQIRYIFQDAGISSNIVVRGFAESKEMQALRQSKVFAELYQEKRESQRNGFIAYLDSFNVNYKEKGLCLVDVGWKGSIQDNIYHIFDGNISIDGFYIGLTGKTISKLGNRKYGLVFSYYPCKSRYCEWFEQQTFLIEQLLSADHGPTLGYMKNNESWKPIFGIDEENDRIYNKVGVIQDKWISTFHKIFNLFQYSCYSAEDMVDVFAKIQLEAVLYRSGEERRLKKEWATASSNNFGTSSGKIVQRSTYEKIKYFLRNFKSSNGNKYFKMMYSLEQITGKLHCDWLNPMIEFITYFLNVNKKL